MLPASSSRQIDWPVRMALRDGPHVGRVTVRVPEHHTIGGDAVEGRCPDNLVPHCPGVKPGLIVRDAEKNVGPVP